jgi:Na+/alanine symporter
MEPLGADLPNAWVPYVFLGAALLVTLMTMGAQVRALVAGVRGWFGSQDSPADATVLLGGAVGMASIVGAAVAVTAGGPGALVWMWIATVLGMAFPFTEAQRAAESPDEAPYFAHHLGGMGKTIAAVFCLAFLAFAVLAGGMLQTHEAASVLADDLGLSIPVGAATVGLIALPFAASERIRGPLLRFGVPLALLAYCGLGLAVATEDSLLLQFAVGDAFNQAFGAGPAAGGAAGGAIAVVAYHGVSRAILAGEMGLGTAMLSTHPAKGDARRGPAAMLVSLLTVSTVTTVTALAVLASPVPRETVIDGDLVPLERALSRGLRPSQQVGQTVVLPENSGLEANSFYAMMMRSNPRGHPFAQLLRKDNAVILPQWKISEGVDQLIFRSRDTKLAPRGAWDVRVDCDVEVIDGKGGPSFVRLTPKDKDLDLGRLITFYELDPKPYVEVGDFDFIGRVAKATSPDENLGDHLAMYEPPSDDRPFNPKFHEFFRGGYRGPYAQSDAPRPPWGWPAKEDFSADVDSVVKLKFEGDPRGDDVLRVNRAGGVEAPPWDLLMTVHEVVIRHDTDPTKDVVVAVTPRLDGYRIRLEATDPGWQDFRKITKMEGYSGPFARIEDFVFEAEVHSDIRLPEEFAGRRSLVPIHEQGEPIGPFGVLPYTPHPGELAQAGIAGPFVVEQGAQIVASRFEHRFGGTGMLAIVSLVFAVSTIAVYAGYAARCAGHLVGPAVGRPVRIVLVGAASAGGLLAFDALFAWVGTAMAAVLAINVVPMILVRGRAKSADAEEPVKEPKEEASEEVSDEASDEPSNKADS